jgi:DNA polymerase III sliding clamp (beta) subunit (PCNA family)
MDIYKEITSLRTDVSSLKTMLSDAIKLMQESSAITFQTHDRKKYLNAKEAATYLNMSDSTFHRYKEKLPYAKKGKRLVYKTEDLDNYLKQINVNEEIDFIKLRTCATV